MVIYIIAGILMGGVVAYLVVSLLLPKVIEQLVLTNNEGRKVAESDLQNKKEAIEKAVKQIYDELRRTSDKLHASEKERVGSFSELKQELENQRRVTEQLSTSTENLKKVLSNNQLRGQFGEQVAEDLLKMTGFVKGVDYEFNKKQKDSETRPDFTIFLPNKVKINVDSKFPYANLQKVAEAEGKTAKEEHLNAFREDVKNKIKQIVSREYINAQDNTVDFVILFIPNEMIFSFIYDKMNDVWMEAMKQKVVFAGPFGFTAILRLVRQAYDNFRYQKNVLKIIGHIKNFEIEFEKYNREFETIGARIKSLSDKYDEVDRTRTSKLIKSIDKIKLEESPEDTPLLDEPAPTENLRL